MLHFVSMNAQPLHKVCGQDDITHLLRELNPNYDNAVNDLHSNWKQHTDNARIESTADDTTYTIQVVVHIVYLQDDLEQNIPDDIIHSQIDALNRDFGVLNPDTVNLRPIFNPFRGYPKIKFELASKDPDGNPTTGILRVAGKAPSANAVYSNPIDSILNALLASVGDWFKKGYTISTLPGNVKDTTIGSPIWDNTKYLNIWVTDLNLKRNTDDGTLGGFAFAPPGLKNWPFGIGYPADNIDGVSIDYRFFGQNNYFVQGNPFLEENLSKGRTTVHEVGHYLGLRHIWGDYGNVFNLPCNKGTHDLFFNDGMDDTPPCKAPYSVTIDGYRCDTTANTCTIPYKGVDYPDLFENYMDYSGDACYNMFTKNQADFLRYVLTTKRAGIISKREVEVVSKINTKNSTENSFSLYPNPAQDVVFLKTSKPLFENTNVELYNVSGQKLQDFVLNKMEHSLIIPIQQLAPATYILKIYNKDGLTTERFLKY